jgi:uncharacterized SAM-binding protein YcdF (DUF218 family)
LNEIFVSLGLDGLKSFFGALLLPPVPFLLLTVVGARLMFRRRLLAWLLILGGVVGAWLASTTAVSRPLTLYVLQAPASLSAAQVADIKSSNARDASSSAIVVLGGGRRALAPEYGTTTLNARSVERLRYGLWLSRETGLPVAFSGGISPAEPTGLSEADSAARIAEREFKLPLRWVENQSRDTRENAQRSVALLKAQGIRRIVLVTHAYHMPRALRNFENAAANNGIRITVAPLGRPTPGPMQMLDWLPTLRGMEETWLACHELLGLLVGA